MTAPYEFDFKKQTRWAGCDHVIWEPELKFATFK